MTNEHEIKEIKNTNTKDLVEIFFFLKFIFSPNITFFKNKNNSQKIFV